MKKYIGILFTFMLLYTFSITSFAETRQINIDGETVTIETIGDVELIDPVYIPETRSDVTDFKFNINDSVDTEPVTNTHAKWQVQTQALLRNFLTGDTKTDSNFKYTVSVMRGYKALASYTGKADNKLGGLTFSKMPINAELYIRVKIESRHDPDYFLNGHGETQFLD